MPMREIRKVCAAGGRMIGQRQPIGNLSPIYLQPSNNLFPTYLQPSSKAFQASGRRGHAANATVRRTPAHGLQATDCLLRFAGRMAGQAGIGGCATARRAPFYIMRIVRITGAKSEPGLFAQSPALCILARGCQGGIQEVAGHSTMRREFFIRRTAVNTPYRVIFRNAM